MIINTTLPKQLSWLPPYQIRTSSRARYLRLSICPKQGLIVTLPQKLSQKHIIPFLIEQQAWLLKHKTTLLQSTEPIDLTEHLHFRAIDHSYTVSYAHEPTFKRARLSINDSNVTIVLPKKDPNLAHSALCQFIRNCAEQHLLPWLEKLSGSCKLPFESACIRSQQQRWGSCSSDKRISLNDKLLFLPPELVNHVMIHELCHTIHLNHSDQFWKLVKHFDQHCDRLKLTLKKAEHAIPRCL